MTPDGRSADLVRSRAERYLAMAAFQSLASDGPLPPGFDRDVIARHRQIGFEAALEIYADLGLVSVTEAAPRRLGY